MKKSKKLLVDLFCKKVFVSGSDVAIKTSSCVSEVIGIHYVPRVQLTDVFEWFLAMPGKLVTNGNFQANYLNKNRRANSFSSV